MSKTAPTVAVDLVDEFLESPAVARMLGYAEMAGPNAVSLAVHDLRQGRPAVVDSALLPPEWAADYFDRAAHASLRLRLQRGHAPEVVIPERAAVAPEVTEEATEEVVG
ncbi:hypothetical protein M3F32_07810 [Dietzia cinnamea]|uniref:hypothetical protein n=1 Tax=Dietzia cinnamea TaxID=321318 RepID=UPI00223C39D9|nr:hypothetical protein [Dietzia cinnamea]MCT2264494.1 hypothetical protein [Dietzia cinnamea]